MAEQPVSSIRKNVKQQPMANRENRMTANLRNKEV